jgi:hypothetical protein
MLAFAHVYKSKKTTSSKRTRVALNLIKKETEARKSHVATRRDRKKIGRVDHLEEIVPCLSKIIETPALSPKQFFFVVVRTESLQIYQILNRLL